MRMAIRRRQCGKPEVRARQESRPILNLFLLKLEAVSCSLCGSGDAELAMKVPSLRLPGDLWFELRRCRSCGLVYLSPRPVDEVMAELYQPQHYTAPRQDLVRRLEGMITNERVTFVNKHTPGRRLLDVGCGNGGFVIAMAAAGYDVFGLEPYQGTSDALPEALRSRIEHTPFAAANYPKEHFDLITFWHVLEHLAQPVETLQRIRGFLKREGRLIVEVPNLACRESNWLGPYWYNLDAPYHFWHFTPQTLEAIVHKAGFEVTTVVTSAVTRPVWLLNYLLLGASVAAKRWQALHPVWGNWPRANLALGLAMCAGGRVLFAGSCPMMRVVARIGA